jgi:phosphoribulokinase
MDLLGPERVTHVCIDDYHKYDRRERSARGITPLHPDCNYIDVIELHLEQLHYGQPILKPVYDHATGTLVRPEYVRPRDFVIVEGLLALHTPVMRQFYDVKVFLDPPEELRRLWKLRRDTAKRAYTTEQALAEIERRAPDSLAFIRPQRRHADVAVQFRPPRGVSPEDAGPHLDVRLTLRPTLPHPDLTAFVAGLASTTSAIRLSVELEEGRTVRALEIDGNVTAEHAAGLEAEIWRHLPDLSSLAADQFGNYLDRSEVCHSDPLALTQLLLTYHVLTAQLQRAFARPVAALSRLRATPEGTVAMARAITESARSGAEAGAESAAPAASVSAAPVVGGES